MTENPEYAAQMLTPIRARAAIPPGAGASKGPSERTSVKELRLL